MTGSEFENHQVFEKLEQFKNRINDNDFREMIGSQDLMFYETAENYLRDRLKLTIPSIVQESELSTISQELENALSQINTYFGNQNIGHLTNATNHLYSAISRVRNLPLPFSKNDFNFSKSVAQFEKITQEKYDNLELENSKLKDTIDELTNLLDSNKAEIQNITTLLEQKETEIQNLNSNFQTEFINIKNNANQNFESDRNAFKSEFDSLKQNFINENETVKEEINTDTSEIILSLNNKLNEAKKIVGVIADVSVTGNYQLIANNNKNTADNFRMIAIVLMLILSGLLIYTIWDISGDTFDWTKSLVRIIAATALSYPATYAARESSKHRKLEILNRKAELELAAINPFIELLPDNKKQEIKEKLVEKYFGNSYSIDENNNVKDDDISASALDKILNTILPYLKNNK